MSPTLPESRGPGQASPAAHVVVFYDGACPVCRREIRHYRRLDRDARIDFADIAVHPEALAGTGLTPAQARRRFHVIDAQGRLCSGATAFMALWAQLPGWRRLARRVRALRLTAGLEAVYRLWAAWRWHRLQRRRAAREGQRRALRTGSPPARRRNGRWLPPG